MTFIEFAKAHGLEIKRLIPSDKIQRCPTATKPRSDNGAYVWDGQRGWVQDWATGGSVIWFQGDKPWTPEEKKVWIDRRRSQIADKEDTYARAAIQAELALNKARLDGHPYLVAKGFPKELGFVLDDKLLIPMRNHETGKLQGYQSIYESGGKFEKKMLYGMRAKGAVLTLGSSNLEIWLVEGYATGLSVKAALKQMSIPATVVVCFSANNLVDIAKKYQSRRKVFVFADNDESKAGETAAINSCLPWTMADEVGMDANDLHQKKGLMRLAMKINELRKEYLV